MFIIIIIIFLLLIIKTVQTTEIWSWQSSSWNMS